MTVPGITRMFSHDLVGSSIHTLAFYMMPSITTITLDTVLVVFDSCTTAATGIFGGSGSWVPPPEPEVCL